MPLLRAGDYLLELTPDIGGAIARFEWRGQPLMRTSCGPSIFDTACFPLVPFSNRIAFGRFEADGREVVLPPNFPGAEHAHPLHGFGWLAPWSIIEQQPARAILRHHHAPDAWPWRYEAEQMFELSPDGLRQILSVRNLGDSAMPAGLGFHPYFPRTDRTVYAGRHRGEWQTSAEGLPLRVDLAPSAIDWWHGAPVGSRTVDTVYTGREGTLRIDWPERNLRLRIEPAASLTFTVIYTPAGQDFLRRTRQPYDRCGQPLTGTR